MPRLETLLDSNLSSAGRCGMFKCFFPARDQMEGYLMQQVSRMPTGVVWPYATALSSKFRVQHLHRGPPVVVNMTPALSARLRAFRTVSLTRGGLSSHALATSHQVLAEPVRTCPKPNYLFKCNPFNLAEAGTRFPENAVMVAEFQEQLPSEAQKRDFLSKLSHSLRETEQMLESEACLRDDFQAFVTSEGDLFHFDLDRCLQSSQPSTILNKSQSADRLRQCTAGVCFKPMGKADFHTMAQMSDCFAKFHRKLTTALGMPWNYWN